jgi:MFS family permease
LTERSLWRHRDFLRLWSAQTVSTFGSLITRAALPFLAILVLGATPGQIAALRIADLLPAFVIGLMAGVWIDRLRRRPLMIVADLGRAVVLGLIPVLAFAGRLQLAQLYLIAVIASILTVCFDVAEQSYIPTVVNRAQLVEANSKLVATQAAAEISAFGVAGWLVQLFTAPVAIAIDALTFLVSAALVGTVRAAEPRARAERTTASVWREMIEGLSALSANRSLRALALSGAAMQCAFGILGTVYALYALRELGFRPGLLGMVYAVGGISSLAASALVGRLNRWLGIGPAMLGGLLLGSIGTLLLPVARGSGLFALLLLVGQQLIGDGGLTVYGINQISAQQALAPDHLLGRVNAGIRVSGLGAMLLGSLLGGVLGQAVGYRPTLVVGAAAMLGGALVVLGSPLVRQPAERQATPPEAGASSQ